MKTILRTLGGSAGLLLAAGLCTQSTYAQLVISVDMDTSALGIQSSRAAVPGDTFDVGIVFDLAGHVGGVSSYGVSLQFNNAELVLNPPAPATTAALETLPAGFTFNITPGVAAASDNIGGGLGQVSTFEAATFGSGPTTGSFTVGTVAFKVLSPITAAGIDITPGLFNAGFDGLFDNASAGISSLTLVGGSVVPEPSTYGAIAGGLLLGWASLRRIRR